MTQVHLAGDVVGLCEKHKQPILKVEVPNRPDEFIVMCVLCAGEKMVEDQQQPVTPSK